MSSIVFNADCHENLISAKLNGKVEPRLFPYLELPFCPAHDGRLDNSYFLLPTYFAIKSVTLVLLSISLDQLMIGVSGHELIYPIPCAILESQRNYFLCWEMTDQIK